MSRLGRRQPYPPHTTRFDVLTRARMLSMSPNADGTVLDVHRGPVDSGDYYAMVDENPYTGMPDADWLGIRTFSPLWLPGLRMWLDASDASTITASGGKVSEWRDKSGLAHHLAQSTDALKPLTGYSLNGLDTIHAGVIESTDAGFDTNEPLTIVAVFRWAATQGNYSCWFSSRTNRACFIGPWQFMYNAHMYWGVGGDGIASDYATTAPHAYLVSAIFNGTANNLRVNGTQTTVGTQGAGGGLQDGLRLGQFGGENGNAFNGEHAEIILCSGALSSTWIAAAEAYLNDKWAVY